MAGGNGRAEPSHFFKVILPSTLEEKKLIDYPYNYEETKREDGDEMESENSVEILSSTKMNTPPVQQNQVKPGSKPENKKIVGVKLETATDNMENGRCPRHGNERSKLKKAAYHEVETDSSDSDEVFDEHEPLASLEENGIFMSGAHRRLSVKERQSLVTAVRLFKPQNPSFVDILRTEGRYSYMYVPSKFSKKHLIRGTRSIKLQDSDGKEWPAQLTWSSGRSIKGGWPAFSKDRNLKQGDVCVCRRTDEGEGHSSESCNTCIFRVNLTDHEAATLSFSLSLSTHIYI